MTPFLGQVSVPSSFVFFLSFIFCPTSFWRRWAAFLGTWCLLLVVRVVLWSLLRVQMFFWWICRGQSGLPVLFLHHLGSSAVFSNQLSNAYLFFFYYYFFNCSGFCHTLKWNSHGFTCVPHPDPLSHLPLHPIPLGLPSAPGPSACQMHILSTGSKRKTLWKGLYK